MIEALTQKRYSFGREFQVELLAIMCRVHGFLNKYRPLIRPSYFEDEVHQDTCRVIFELHDKFGKEPTVIAVGEALRDLVKKSRAKQKMAGEYESVPEALKSVHIEDECDISERVKNFANRTAVAHAICECIEELEAGKPEISVDRVIEASRTASVLEDPGLDFMDDFSWMEWSRAAHTIPLGLPRIDKYLGGGLACKELGIVFAPPSGFKTGTLINFATHALKLGHSVAFGSLELGEQALAWRFARNLVGPAMAAVEKSEQNEFVREKIEAFKERFRSRLTIKRWPPNSIPPSVFRSWLHQLRDMGRICLPGRMTLILCDYPQLFLPQRRNDRREQEIRTNYQAMLQIADEFNCPVWGAVQATRQGSEKVQSRGPSYPKKSMYARNADPSAPTGKFLTTTDIGECFAVAADADVIVTNNQNLDEHARKEIRMGLAKVRDAEDGRMVLAEVEYEYMRLHEKEPSSMTGLARRRDRKAEQEKEEANEVAN